MGTPSTLPKSPAPEKGLIPETLKTVLIFVLLVAVGYVLYDNYQFQQGTNTQLAKVSTDIKSLQEVDQAADAKITSTATTLKGDIAQAQSAAIGETTAALKKTAQQIQAEGRKTRAELDQAIQTKADTAQVQQQVQAVRSDAETKIGQVSTEVGGVKNDVSVVRTDLATTRRDLEGTQRQLLDVRDTLNAAVAKNASELAELRRKGERDYFEFELPKKNQLVKVQDIQLSFSKTDQKKGKYSLMIAVDDSRLEKKDRTINEPVQFLVGQSKLRYEVVVNWVQKNRVGGYLSVPKDKALSAEHTSSATK